MPNASNYYRVLANPDLIHPWFLDEPRTVEGDVIDEREFMNGKIYYGPMPHSINISQAGVEQQFNLGGFDLPIVSSGIALAIKDIAHDDVECFPVIIQQYKRQYAILNVITLRECLNEERSRIMKWTQNDGRPEKEGQYRMVTELHIDKSRVVGCDIFRISGWEIALIVSDAIKNAIEGIGNLGIVFDPV